MKEFNKPRLLIGAPRGGSGKTTFTIGLLRTLLNRGLKVAPFKKGPDYIDPGWLGRAGRALCHNLDQFMMDEDTILKSLYHHSQKADIIVIEGNRGLYDGLDEEGSCSSASLAGLTGSPVIVVIDCTKATRTVAAVVKGLQDFEPRVRLRGVVLNNVSGLRHERMLRKTIEIYTDAVVLGVVGRMEDVPVLMRHLGLITVHEHPEVEDTIERLSEWVSKGIDIERLLSIAREVEPVPVPDGELYRIEPSIKRQARGLRVAVFMDEAFQFYYPENIEVMKMAGIDVIGVDATRQESLPPCDLVYIGGGFPETHAPALSSNNGFKRTFLEAVEKGVGVYAECGGLMFLGSYIEIGGQRYPMTGILPLSFRMESGPVAHGYTIAEVEEEGLFYPSGALLRGHEFHYSRPTLEKRKGLRFVFKMKKGRGIVDGRDGMVSGRVFGTYTHLHALGTEHWLGAMINIVRR